MCGSERGPIVGSHAMLKVALGLVDKEARLGAAGAAEHCIRNNAARCDRLLGALERRYICGDIFDRLLIRFGCCLCVVKVAGVGVPGGSRGAMRRP